MKRAPTDAARKIRGKTIARVYLQPFDPNEEGSENYEEEATNPVIEFTDGTFLRFNVQETEVAEYGVKLIYPARSPKV